LIRTRRRTVAKGFQPEPLLDTGVTDDAGDL
jgi:hypothetical protein